MSTKISIFQSLIFLFYRLVLRRNRNPKPKYQKCPSLPRQTDLSHRTLIFNVEGALLRSESLFPYFMLVAFEAGGLIRSFLLLVLYPLICLMSEEMGMKIMVFVSLFGVKGESFRAGKAVLPKFFLEDVGLEMFEVLRRAGKRVGVSDLPRVMVEGFLKDYLEIDVVIGREMKEFRGYFVGVMEDKQINDKLLQRERQSCGRVVGITSLSKPLHHYLFSHCQEIYLVKNRDKRSWQSLPRTMYPKPLIFHDSRLAIRPTPLNTLALFMWIPFAAVAAVARLFVALTVPFSASIPLLSFSGLRLTASADHNPRVHAGDDNEHEHEHVRKGCLYVCNHRTLLDPLYISFALKTKNISAVTYSLSRVSEILAPIKTVRLTRDRNRDGETMDKLLKQGDLVVCPEGGAKGEVANHVQGEIGKALGFECTNLTRRDKYLILAGNNGIVTKN